MQIVVISPFTAERTALEALLRNEGHQVSSALDRSHGLALAARTHTDVIIADAQLPMIDGPALMHELSRQDPAPRVILLCPRSNCALQHPGVVCLTKPITDMAQLYRHLAPPAPKKSRVA